jgi:hypothetical protein
MPAGASMVACGIAGADRLCQPPQAGDPLSALSIDKRFIGSWLPWQHLVVWGPWAILHPALDLYSFLQ